MARTTERDKEKDTHRQATARQRTSNLYSKMGDKARRRFRGTATKAIAESVAPTATDDERNENDRKELRGILGIG